MMNLHFFTFLGCLVLYLSPLGAATPVAEWSWKDISNNTAPDTSGNNHSAKLNFVIPVKDGAADAVRFDGTLGWIDCGKLPIVNAVAFELWFKPTRKAKGLACILGEGLRSYFISYYNTEVCDFFIGGGDNFIRGGVKVDQWNHIAASFDGKIMKIFVNGVLKRKRIAKHLQYKTAGRLIIGTKGRVNLPRIKGLIGTVRVYNQALDDAIVAKHFNDECVNYGFSADRKTKISVKAYYYFAYNTIIVATDYSGFMPFRKGRLIANLVRADTPGRILNTMSNNLGKGGEGKCDLGLLNIKLEPGKYLINVKVIDGKKVIATEKVSFDYPLPKPVLPAPSKLLVQAPALSGTSSKFRLKMQKSGGFAIQVNGTVFPFQTRISYPNANGRFNRLGGNAPTGMRVKTVKVDDNTYNVVAVGKFYTLKRTIKVNDTHIYVRDNYRNTTANDIGLLIYNEVLIPDSKLKTTLLSGYECRGRRPSMKAPDYSPSVFITDSGAGLGVVPIDDVYVVHAEPYIEQQASGIADEKFALAPGANYTLEYALYPNSSRDYYDFINAFRRAENRIGTVGSMASFVGRSLKPDGLIPPKETITRLNTAVIIMTGFIKLLDNPALAIEGFEYVDFPKHQQLIKEQAAAIKKRYPGLKVIPHIAHSLYTTNKPERFRDSQVISAKGKQVFWGDNFGKAMNAKNWHFWIFYPTPGNSFHKMMMRNLDILMDDMKMDGVFMDGFLAGYISQWTYNKWDGHSAEIDRRTGNIKRKIGSVILMSTPSMVELARKVRDKGGIIYGNNTVFVRTIAKEKYIRFNLESAAGPEQHLAPVVMALARAYGPSLHNECDVYRDMIEKLRFGMAWFSFGEPWQRFPEKTMPTLASKEYPITFEEIRAGMFRGPERIVTMNSGVYSFPRSRKLHLVWRFDERGGVIPNDAVTTVDGSRVCTQLKLAKYESAVIEPSPFELTASQLVNARLEAVNNGFLLTLNGKGKVTLFLNGEYDINVNGQTLSTGKQYAFALNGITAVRIIKK